MKHLERRKAIVDAGIQVAEKRGYRRLTGAVVANHAGISLSLIQHHFPTIEHLRGAVLKRAIKAGNAMIVLQALVARENLALKAPLPLKCSALQMLKRIIGEGEEEETL